MYACPTCGAGLKFDPKSQQLLCLSCRNKYDPENIEKMRLDKAKEVQNQESPLKKDEYEAISYKCSHCGAELITTDETITTFCSFCRTGTMLDRKLVKKTKPDYVIPFTKTKEECEKIYVDKIRKAFFAPKSMIDTQEVEKIRGIYMPYWIYSFEKNGETKAKGSKYSHRSGDYEYYDDYTLTTDIDAECSGIIHDATSNFSDRLSEAIAPFSVKEKKEFSAAYLSGFYADNEDVDKDVYTEESSQMASKHISSRLGKDKEYRRYGAKPSVSLNQKSAELALFPVYYLATKNKAGDRISYAVINGQTGKITADIPIDFKKFILSSLALAIPLFLLLNLFITISMPMLIFCAIVFNMISLVVLISQNKKISIRENDLDDKGFLAKASKIGSDKKEKKKGSIFDKSILKPLIGLLLTIIVFILKPASDIYYYTAAIISIFMAIWSFYNIISKYNMLTTRKLPQLGKRGGDENA